MLRREEQRSEDREHDVLGSSRVDGPTAEVGGELAGVNESTESENVQRTTFPRFVGDDFAGESRSKLISKEAATTGEG